jgi:microcystin-dependent protein
MPYVVRFTDQDKTPVTVFDNTINADTSIKFPGRNYPGYGQIIAENFLSLLENFASTEEPINPVEGQLWYNSQDKILEIWDNESWKAASNIQKGSSEPSVETSRAGELWVDTTNQQLYVFSGQNWILVGPTFSTGLRSGPVVESIIDSDNFSRVVLIFYVEDNPVIIISKDSFTPKNLINGFSTIRTGVNITTEDIGEGGFLPKFYGTASAADSLNVGTTVVPAGRFLRSDTTNTTEQQFNVRNNAGVVIGVDGTFSLTASTSAGKIYTASPGSSIDLQTNRNGIPSTVLRVINDTVGINKDSPDEALDVVGNIQTDGSIKITNAAESTGFGIGSIQTAGGVAVSKNLLVGTNLEVRGSTSVTNLEPLINDRYELGGDPLAGGKRWNKVWTKVIEAETIVGSLEGNIIGNASTSTNLRIPTTFRLEGDVTSQNIIFDGQQGGNLKVFQTEITAGLISERNIPSPNISNNDDFILTFRPGTGLLKQQRDNFVADLGVPIGAIFPFAGNTVPNGYLLCDGSEIEIAKYNLLYNIVGNAYGTPTRGAPGLTFVLPDFRGRFALGRQNMDNNLTVPIVGGFIDAGGGLPNTEVVLAGSFVVGRRYTISSAGTTNFVLIGAASNTIGVTFVATGAGTGTGTATVAIRVDDSTASALGGTGGSYENALTKFNLPQHEHDFRALDEASGVKAPNPFFATRLETTTPNVLETQQNAFLGRGPTTPGQMQYLPSSGGVKGVESNDLGQSFSLMNPYLTVNYIIRSGPPLF